MGRRLMDVYEVDAIREGWGGVTPLLDNKIPRPEVTLKLPNAGQASRHFFA